MFLFVFCIFHKSMECLLDNFKFHFCSVVAQRREASSGRTRTNDHTPWVCLQFNLTRNHLQFTLNTNQRARIRDPDRDRDKIEMEILIILWMSCVLSVGIQIQNERATHWASIISDNRSYAGFDLNREKLYVNNWCISRKGLSNNLNNFNNSASTSSSFTWQHTNSSKLVIIASSFPLDFEGMLIS